MPDSRSGCPQSPCCLSVQVMGMGEVDRGVEEGAIVVGEDFEYLKVWALSGS